MVRQSLLKRPRAERAAMRCRSLLPAQCTPSDHCLYILVMHQNKGLHEHLAPLALGPQGRELVLQLVHVGQVPLIHLVLLRRHAELIM